MDYVISISVTEDVVLLPEVGNRSRLSKASPPIPCPLRIVEWGLSYDKKATGIKAKEIQVKKKVIMLHPRNLSITTT